MSKKLTDFEIGAEVYGFKIFERDKLSPKDLAELERLEGVLGRVWKELEEKGTREVKIQCYGPARTGRTICIY